MTKHMLIDATHPEETRVVVVDGQRLEEFDVETAQKKPLKGNIYLAKVVRVEPSLQAAFVDYGGNRHGFLAFNEIHPDYYRIPIADREALLAEEAEAFSEQAEREYEDADRGESRVPVAEPTSGDMPEPPAEEPGESADEDVGRAMYGAEDSAASGEAAPEAPAAMPTGLEPDTGAREDGDTDGGEMLAGGIDGEEDGTGSSAGEDHGGAPAVGPSTAHDRHEDADDDIDQGDTGQDDEDDSLDDGQAMPLRRDAADPVLAKAGDSIGELVPAPEPGQVEEVAPAKQAVPIETVGGDEIDEAKLRRRYLHRRYKIQEVIKRRQIMLVQVTKEERGTKGAALTTYLSLAGRYCVLMPNTGSGGGISRKISNPGDRKRLKSVLDELGIPDGMSVIVRTAGSERTKAEIRRDCDYLLRLWDGIREQTLKSTAPALIHEEANLIKRSIRDLYARDIDDVIVEGEEGYKAAKSFMRMLMPSHAKRVQLYKDEKIPLFQRYHVESQLDAIHSPVVQLKSGGYVVLNQTEALVAIDVNSGRATRERHIEETALKTNLEAASEIARQLRLRDLAGLIVIDFIDMEEQRHNNAVERKLKEAMRQDRARIQIGRISPFGLLELSRQRLRPSLVEASTEVCRFCRGVGHVRSIESTALHMLRSIEDEAIRKPAPGFSVSAPIAVALYLLNQKRRALAEIEMRHGVRIYINGDDSLIRPDFELERLQELLPGEQPPAQLAPTQAAPEVEDEEEIEDEADEAAESEVEESEERPAEREGRGRRRRGRRRGRGEDRGREQRREETPREEPRFEAGAPVALAQVGPMAEGEATESEMPRATFEGARPEADQGDGERPRRRRRRGRRGGRRRRGRQRDQEGTGELPVETAEPQPQPQPRPRPVIPSPADFRFAGDADAIGAEDEDELDAEALSRVNAAAAEDRGSAESDADRFEDEEPRRDQPVTPPRGEASEKSTDREQPAAGPAETPAAASEPSQPEGPRRGGWWQRRGFGS
jgi:ribonuclease E